MGLPGLKGRSLPHTLSALYFFSYGPSGLIFPFLPLLLAGRGMTPTSISIVMTMNPLVNLVAPPLWAAAADALHARVALIRVLLVGCGFSALLLLPNGGIVLAALAMIVFCVFRTPLPSLLDSATVAELQGRTGGYSRIRAWGSLAFALGAGVAGVLDRAEHVEIVVGIAAAMYLTSASFALRLDAPPMVRERQVLRKTLDHVRSAGLIPIFAASALYYAAHSVFDIHFSLFMDRIQARDLVGPSWMVGVLCEVAIMFAAPAYLKARAPRNVLVAASLVATLRWFVLSLIPGRPILVGIQVLHGVTFGVWYLSLVRETQENAPEELRSSVQAAMLTAVGVGTIAGYVIGGFILEEMGGAWLWRIAAMTSGASAIIYSLAAATRPGAAGAPKR